MGAKDDGLLPFENPGYASEFNYFLADRTIKVSSGETLRCLLMALRRAVTQHHLANGTVR